jgi:Spherulation-specific family 4
MHNLEPTVQGSHFAPSEMLCRAFAMAVIVLLVFGNLQRQAQLDSSICLKDSSTGDQLGINFTTGEFLWCSHDEKGKSFSMVGSGSVLVRGCVVTLQDFSGDHRMLARYDTSVNRGTAFMRLLPTGSTMMITDTNVGNHSCDCVPFNDRNPFEHQIIIPLYSYPIIPDGPSADDPDQTCDRKVTPDSGCNAIPAGNHLSRSWQQVIAAKIQHREFEMWAVVNPSSGPNAGSADRDNYNLAICQLRKAGIRVLGYVCTKFAGQPPSSPTNCMCGTSKTVTTSCVKSDIDAWKNNYEEPPDGIFFDEMASEEGDTLEPDPSNPGRNLKRSDFYRIINEYAKNNGFTFTVGNPGIFKKDQIGNFSNTADTIIIHEQSGFPTISYLADLPADIFSKWGIIARDIPSPPENKDGDCARADWILATQNVKYIYTTDASVYSRTPCFSYLDTLICNLKMAPTP